MDFSLLGLWSQMGIVAKLVVITLLVMSAFAIWIAIDRLLTFQKSRKGSMEYLRALQPLIGAQPDLGQAASLGERWKHAPLARVIGTGLNEFGSGLHELGPAASDTVEIELLLHGVGRSMDRARKRELAGLQRGLPMLATIASSAPFVGLFGTTFGIITAFEQMADPSKGGGGGLATVSAGIAEALLTTAVGLAVAIVSVWFYNFFTNRADELGAIMEDATGELNDRLLHGSRTMRGGSPQGMA